jgi:hypothetical protein
MLPLGRPPGPPWYPLRHPSIIGRGALYVHEREPGDAEGKGSCLCDLYLVAWGMVSGLWEIEPDL